MISFKHNIYNKNFFLISKYSHDDCVPNLRVESKVRL